MKIVYPDYTNTPKVKKLNKNLVEFMGHEITVPEWCSELWIFKSSSYCSYQWDLVAYSKDLRWQKSIFISKSFKH